MTRFPPLPPEGEWTTVSGVVSFSGGHRRGGNGLAVRRYLRRPGVQLRAVELPGASGSLGGAFASRGAMGGSRGESSSAKLGYTRLLEGGS